jgi:hypothetical protein
MQSQPQLADTKVWVGNGVVPDTGKQLLGNHALNFLKFDLSTFLYICLTEIDILRTSVSKQFENYGPFIIFAYTARP